MVAQVLSPANMAKVRKLAMDPQIDAEIKHDIDLGVGAKNRTPDADADVQGENVSGRGLRFLRYSQEID